MKTRRAEVEKPKALNGIWTSALGASWTAQERSGARISWAELLLRVFREDVLLCPCGCRRVVLAFITEKKVVREILEHLGLPADHGPPIAPARITAAGEDAPWQDDVPELQQMLR